jgi:hypothetical protein
VDGWLRCLGGTLGFGFAAVWITASLAAAFVCFASAAAGYGAVLVTERVRATRAGRAASHSRPASSRLAPPSVAPKVEELPRRADELNHDLGHVYQPPAEAEYGWPANEDTVA